MVSREKIQREILISGAASWWHDRFMFTLHPQLAADTTPITTLELCHVRLLKDANYPWLVLVPGRPDITGMHQLAAADGATLMAEIRHASDVLEKLYTPTRINVAALGNMVAQLHIHV